MSELGWTSEQLPAFKGTEYEDHVNTWLDVDRSVQGHYWMLGAVAASLDKKYGANVFGKFGSDVGSSRRRIEEYARTYREWEKRERSRILSFHHHTIAGRAEDPRKTIEAAEDERLSTRELDKFVKTGELPSREDIGETGEAGDVDGDVEEPGPDDVVRIVKAGKMEFIVEFGDGKRHTITRAALLRRGFGKCKTCGFGVVHRHEE